MKNGNSGAGRCPDAGLKENPDGETSGRELVLKSGYPLFMREDVKGRLVRRKYNGTDIADGACASPLLCTRQPEEQKGRRQRRAGRSRPPSAGETFPRVLPGAAARRGNSPGREGNAANRRGDAAQLYAS